MLRQRQKKLPDPLEMEPTRFDRWSEVDLFGVLETQVMEMASKVEALPRCDHQQKQQALALLLPKLATATAVTQALQRKVANDKRTL